MIAAGVKAMSFSGGTDAEMMVELIYRLLCHFSRTREADYGRELSEGWVERHPPPEFTNGATTRPMEGLRAQRLGMRARMWLKHSLMRAKRISMIGSNSVSVKI
jgi:hypothetical protein